MGQRIADDRGLTLIEMLITVTVLGAGFIAILAGLTTTMRTSSLHRQQSRGEAIVREYAEKVDAAAYVPCAAPAIYEGAYTPPTGWTATVVDVRYLDATTNAYVGCPADTGVQVVSVRVAHDGGDVTERLDVVKRVP
jgi:Tfp pilus assembly protein PilV